MVIYDIENVHSHKMVKIGATEQEALAFLNVTPKTLREKVINGELIRQWYKVRAGGAFEEEVCKVKLDPAFYEHFKRDWNRMRRRFGKEIEND